MRLGIDATFLRFGGEVTYLRELLNHSGFRPEEIVEIVVVAPEWVLGEIPDFQYITKKSFPWLQGKLFWRWATQLNELDGYFKEHTDMVFSISGEYTGKMRPLVAVAQNLAVFDMDYWKEWWRLRDTTRQWFSLRRHFRCIVQSDGIIYLSKYARNYIHGLMPVDQKKQIVVPNGVSPVFSAAVKPQLPISAYSAENPFRLLYVAGIQSYKNHRQLMEAVKRLHFSGYPVELHLVGKIMYRPAGLKFKMAMAKADPRREFIRYHGALPSGDLAAMYKKADAYVFPSSGLTMPNSVMEAITAGLPVICSDKQPLPEFVKDNGFYFRAGEIESMETVIAKFITSPERRELKAQRAKAESRNWDWGNAARLTFEFVTEVYHEHQQK